MRTLPRSITDLTRPHYATKVNDLHEELSGIEPPLLEILHRAIGSSVGGSGGGAARQSSALLVNPAALSLWQEISRYVAKARWGLPTLPPGESTTPMAEHMEALAWEIADTLEMSKLIDRAADWAIKIRELVDPPKTVPLRGVECPACGQDYATVLRDDEWVRTDPILIRVQVGSMHAEADCLNCARYWDGGELLDLKAAIAAGGCELEGSVV